MLYPHDPSYTRPILFDIFDDISAMNPNIDSFPILYSRSVRLGLHVRQNATQQEQADCGRKQKKTRTISRLFYTKKQTKKKVEPAGLTNCKTKKTALVNRMVGMCFTRTNQQKTPPSPKHFEKASRSPRVSGEQENRKKVSNKSFNPRGFTLTLVAVNLFFHSLARVTHSDAAEVSRLR